MLVRRRWNRLSALRLRELRQKGNNILDKSAYGSMLDGDAGAYNMAPALRWSWSLRWIHPPRGKEKVFAVMREYELHALFDESNTDRRHGYCIVAGFVGMVQEWEQFEAIWELYGTKTPFHAKRFFARNPRGDRVSPYNGWSDEQADKYFKELLRAINDANITPVASGVHLDAFWQFSSEERHKLTGATWGQHFQLSGAPNRPYYLPFQDVMIHVVEGMKNPNRGVSFSFDENPPFARHANQIYFRIKDAATRADAEFAARMNRITFESDSINIGLQAADLLAYSWFKYLPRGDALPPEIDSLIDILDKKPGGSWARLWDKATMDKFLKYEPSQGITSP